MVKLMIDFKMSEKSNLLDTTEICKTWFGLGRNNSLEKEMQTDEKIDFV